MSTETEHRRLLGFRERKDQFFKTNENSPLTATQKETFESLSYYEPNPELSFILEMDREGEGVGEDITVGTMTGEPKEYTRVGRITFEVEGTPATLSIFADKTSGKFFLPFRDATAGEETYSVGRYLDPKARPDGKLVVDFNMAYNPYCAYNFGWTCTIPPMENRIEVPIRAGEKLPEFDHEVF
jgi:uncharacterized protein (DUF1684 family)